jgi:protein-S-isoprenylcysteine O-methyltransferase Ste14
MDESHWVLVMAWILFGLVHSLTAAEPVKRFFFARMGRWALYYRLSYSVLALLSLVAVLAWQLSFPSPVIASFPVLQYVVGLLAGLPGILLMFVSIRKYFFNLSGVGVFWGKEDTTGLELDGLHRYTRHPLYLGTLLFIWSLFFFFPLLSNLLSCLIITLYTLLGARLEERKLLIEFGPAYAAYQKRVPMLIPGLRF